MRKVLASVCFVGFGLVVAACAGATDVDMMEPDSGGFIPTDPQPSACKHVDLLFSIDASASMSEEIQALSRDVFPQFATQLANLGDGIIEDFRIGLIDACPRPASLHSQGNALDTMGNPIVKDCAFESGKPWMDSKSSKLEAEFSCVSNVYTGDQDAACSAADIDDFDERPAYSAMKALSAPARDEANAGFLRDDAFLVVVAISDEDEELNNQATNPEPLTDPVELYNSLVAIKGDVKDMVFLGIGGAPATGSSCSGVYGSALKAINLKTVTDMFIAEERGVYWDLCSGRLEDGISDAINVIERGCNIVK